MHLEVVRPGLGLEGNRDTAGDIADATRSERRRCNDKCIAGKVVPDAGLSLWLAFGLQGALENGFLIGFASRRLNVDKGRFCRTMKLCSKQLVFDVSNDHPVTDLHPRADDFVTHSGFRYTTGTGALGIVERRLHHLGRLFEEQGHVKPGRRSHSGRGYSCCGNRLSLCCIREVGRPRLVGRGHALDAIVVEQVFPIVRHNFGVSSNGWLGQSHRG